MWKIGDLLGEQSVRIPDYQRPYKWDVRNVAQLIDDVQEFMRLGAYQLGSIILHEDENQDLNIVDGQQRFITLVLSHTHWLLRARRRSTTRRSRNTRSLSSG